MSDNTGDDDAPFIGHCGFCEQGLLRFRLCPACYTICAVCDECELIWENIPGVSEDASAPAAGSFPMCPSCGSANEVWAEVTPQELAAEGLEQFVRGDSV